MYIYATKYRKYGLQGGTSGTPEIKANLRVLVKAILLKYTKSTENVDFCSLANSDRMSCVL